MPQPRRLTWVVSLLGIVLVAYVLPWSEAWREAGPLALLLVLTLIGLAVELILLARRSRMRSSPDPPGNARPADGTVGILPMAGVRGEPNPRDPRFRRFLACEAAASPAALKPDRDLHATPLLLGRVVVISVFIGRDGRSWSDAEIARAHAALVRAGAWIEREAIRWSAPVNVDLAETYFVVDDHAPEDVEVDFAPTGEEMHPLEAHAATKALAGASRAAGRLGFPDAVALTAAINPRLPADARVWLLHPRRAGCSLAVLPEDTAVAGVSLAVCYAREASFPEPLSGPPFTDPVTIVHELLHLFGASDKYGVSLRAYPRRSVTNREIMRLDIESLARSRIDPLTAQEIGWTRPE